jgi:hypothetical protein
MVRERNSYMATRSRKTTIQSATEPNTLTCPECGKTFTRPAALGAHRQRVHGVAGSSQNAKAQRAKTDSRRRARTTTSSRPSRQSAAPATANGTGRGVNRDALLQTLFPTGIPPREDVIRAVNSWLNEAERLATLGRS